MGEVEKILKTVDMDGEQVEIWMTKMMDPCTAEEFEAMSLEEREHAKIQPALNQRTYSPEDGIICMQDVPVKMMSQRAAEAAGFNALTEQLTGPNAIAFSDDAVAPSRVLAKFAKKHDKLVLKGAIVEGKVVGVDTIKELSSLPNRDGMLSMLLSCLQAPVRSFACAVKAVADKDGEAAPAEEAAAE